MDSEPRANSGIAALVSGIVADLKDLLTLELKIAWAGVQRDLRQATLRLVVFAVAVGLLLLGTLLVMQMLVQLLYTGLDWPLWACYGVVGFLGLSAGALLIARAR